MRTPKTPPATLERAKAYMRKYREENKDKVRASKRRYYERNLEKCKQRARVHYHQKRKLNRQFSSSQRRRQIYGLSDFAFNYMSDSQNFACAVCKQTPEAVDGKAKVLQVDHNHSTGKVRALLCGNCNRALGLLHDRIDLCLSLADYLRYHQEMEGTHHGN